MISLFVFFIIGLFVWTTSALLSNGIYHVEIKNEIDHISESLKSLFSSFATLCVLLIKDAISSTSNSELNTVKDNVTQNFERTAIYIDKQSKAA